MSLVAKWITVGFSAIRIIMRFYNMSNKPLRYTLALEAYEVDMFLTKYLFIKLQNTFVDQLVQNIKF